MVKDLLNEALVDVNVEAKDWEEAIRAGGKLLLDAGFIKAPFIDEMVETVHEFGPYIVIEKGIALAHAEPSENVLKIGIAMHTLKDPISFGNEDNDPVKLVISLCATDADSHVEAIGDLANIMMSDDAMNKIFEAKTKEDILNAISSVN
ncbi:MAG: PTS sugar transporter subunit IIA [Eubacteriales bacterium]|nr:PTS sugar transporter subunit IIA [Eubacteriales bacterium]